MLTSCCVINNSCCTSRYAVKSPVGVRMSFRGLLQAMLPTGFPSNHGTQCL